MSGSSRPHATTIVAVRRDDRIAVAGDGQVTVGDIVMKHSARKVRRIYHGTVVVGFAGAVADAFTLFDRFEAQLDKHAGNLLRGAIGLAKEWRTDRFLRHLDAMLVTADQSRLLLVSGDGEIIEPDDSVIAIGSGGPYAQAAARALVENTDLDAEQVARRALAIAASLCIYTNDTVTVEVVEARPAPAADASAPHPAPVPPGPPVTPDAAAAPPAPPPA